VELIATFSKKKNTGKKAGKNASCNKDIIKLHKLGMGTNVANVIINQQKIT
jgi:hypothetical protein